MDQRSSADIAKPLILITGAAGNLGSALAAALSGDYRIVGLDREASNDAIPILKADLTSALSITEALGEVARLYGRRFASVIHLAAYFDFTGEDHPLYQALNVEGTVKLLRALQAYEVEQFIYSGTMLVHAAGKPGDYITEETPTAPKWAYPKSKAAAEAAIVRDHGRIPYVLLHLAGIYDDRTAVPTLSQQIARIYERNFQAYMYSGDPQAGQSMLHKEDMVDAFRRTVDRRKSLPENITILIGETEALGYDELQDAIGREIHGEDEWPTLRLPKRLAVAGAGAMGLMETLIPDAIDEDKKPFIKPFMIAMSDDHYALDISRARDLLGWSPQHSLKTHIQTLIGALKADPLHWYRANGMAPPAWVISADTKSDSVEQVRSGFEAQQADQQNQYRWPHMVNIALGTWLMTLPPAIGLDGPMVISDIASGLALMLFASLALSRRLWGARWICAAIGAWVLSAPMLFWSDAAAAYAGDTLIGALIIGLAIGFPPEPGVSPATHKGPDLPPGWRYNPSAWSQRLPIIALAFLGLYVSRYMAAYQLGHVDTVWEPFFAGNAADPKNGTEEIITSEVSKAWPVPDAAVGALTYALEIVTGLVGSRARWRTMPWLVIIFGLMIVPLGVVSITFIIIQPIVIGTWCTLCLIGAAAMLVQIPYSVDELVATGQFLHRRHKAGQNVFKVLFTGDTDEGDIQTSDKEFDGPPLKAIGNMVGGGVTLPWTLAAAIVIGAWLMCTRIFLGAEAGMANADHVIGALVLTVVALSAAEVTRILRFLLIPLGAALLITPFMFTTGVLSAVASLICGVALICLAFPRGQIDNPYGTWDQYIR